MPMASRGSAIAKAQGMAIVAIIMIAAVAAGSHYALMPKPAPARPAEEGAPGPGPTIAYALGRGIPEGIAKRLAALDSDGVMDDRERALVDYLARLANMADAARLQDRAIDSILSDGVVSQEEARALAYLSGFPSGANRAFVELGLEGDVIRYLCLMASLGDQSFARYAVENRLCIGDGRLDDFEVKFLIETERHPMKLFEMYAKEGGKIYPGLIKELTKLPDLKTVEERDLEAVEDILSLAADPKYRAAFEAILNEGIPEKRKYCTPLQALLWILHDKEPDDGQLKRIVSDPIRLTEYAWRHSSESKDYASDRWKNFYEVVDRLNSPDLISIYMRDNIRYKTDLALYGKENYCATALETFVNKAGDCEDHAMFALYILRKNGYNYNNFEIYSTNAVCGLDVQWGKIGEPVALGHAVCLYKLDNRFWYLDNCGVKKGPFQSIEDVVNSISPSWKLYQFFDENWKIGKKVHVKNCVIFSR